MAIDKYLLTTFLLHQCQAGQKTIAATQQALRHWDRKEYIRFLLTYMLGVFLHFIWLNDLRICDLYKNLCEKYFKNYDLYLFWLNSEESIILTFCKGQAYHLADWASLALGCVLCSWQEFQKDSWSTSHVCPSDLSTAKHSRRSRQVLGYDLPRPVCFPLHFVNRCFCWLQKQLSFLLSHY